MPSLKPDVSCTLGGRWLGQVRECAQHNEIIAEPGHRSAWWSRDGSSKPLPGPPAWPGPPGLLRPKMHLQKNRSPGRARTLETTPSTTPGRPLDDP